MTYVEGIGDEVLLFFTFVIASFGILLFLFLRETRRRSNNISNQANQTVDAEVDAPQGARAFFDGSNNLQASSTRYSNDSQQRTPVNSSEYFSTTQEEIINATENVTEATRSNEQQSITLRLVLQERTINAQVFNSTTLQELKRYNKFNEILY